RPDRLRGPLGRRAQQQRADPEVLSGALISTNGLYQPRAEQPLCGCRRRGPRSAAGDDGIHEDKELAGAGDEGELMSFSSCDQALVDRLQLCIPIEDSRQGCCVEALPQALASAFDVPWTAS